MTGYNSPVIFPVRLEIIFETTDLKFPVLIPLKLKFSFSPEYIILIYCF